MQLRLFDSCPSRSQTTTGIFFVIFESREGPYTTLDLLDISHLDLHNPHPIYQATVTNFKITQRATVVMWFLLRVYNIYSSISTKRRRPDPICVPCVPPKWWKHSLTWSCPVMPTVTYTKPTWTSAYFNVRPYKTISISGTNFSPQFYILSPCTLSLSASYHAILCSNFWTALIIMTNDVKLNPIFLKIIYPALFEIW